MSFRFLPSPIYIILMLFTATILFYYAITRYRRDNIFMILLYTFMGAGAICEAIHKLIIEYFPNSSILASTLRVGLIIFSVFGLGFFFIEVYVQIKQRPQKVKLLIIPGALLVIALLLALTSYLIYLYGNN